jgi:4-amino-4-deoxy-L-arabinose transferase-like glycosyltransferase
MTVALAEPAVRASRPKRALLRALPDVVWRALTAINFVALLLAAVTLRGWHLENTPGLNGDEAWLGVQAAHLASGDPIVWRTPTGNPINPFLLWPVAALHLVFGPSVVVLRVVALVSGLAALGVNWWLCRRVLDRNTALVSTALLAVMPITIAYSRFAWDASQTLLATTLVLYLALSTVERSTAKAMSWPPADWLPALIAFGVAIWVHPTNVFVLWLLVVPAVYRYGRTWKFEFKKLWKQKRGLVRLAGIGVVALGAAALWCCRGLVLLAAGRAVDPQQAGLFLRRLVRLFSGGTVFEFIPGPPRDTTALDTTDLLLVLLSGIAALGLVQRLRRGNAVRERCLAWATALILVSFYLVAGPDAIAPHFERYAICLIAPCAVLLALGWSHWLRFAENPRDPSAKSSRLRKCRVRVAGMVLAATAWLWLIYFYRDYFVVFETTGGTSHVAFRTAPIEPKLAALNAMLKAENRNQNGNSEKKPIWIVADSWWSYWPLAYFATDRPDVRVVAAEDWPTERERVAATDAVWQVKFAAIDQQANPAEDSNNPPAGEITIDDDAGAPLLLLNRIGH